MYRTKYQGGGQAPDMGQIYQMLMQQGILGDMSFEEFQQLPPEQIQQILAQVQGQQQMAYGGRPKMTTGGSPMITGFEGLFGGQSGDTPEGTPKGINKDLIGFGVGTLANVGFNAMMNPKKAPTNPMNQFATVGGSTAQGALTGFSTFGIPGAIIGGLGGLGLGMLQNEQAKDAYRQSEQERQKPNSIGSLGQSYNPMMAYGGRAEKALVEKIKHKSDNHLLNNYSYGISVNSNGVQKAGINMNRMQYGPGGPFQGYYKKRFQKAVQKSGRSLEDINRNYMMQTGFPLLHGTTDSGFSTNSPLNSGLPLLDPNDPMWAYQPTRDADWRLVNKDFRKTQLRGMNRPSNDFTNQRGMTLPANPTGSTPRAVYKLTEFQNGGRKQFNRLMNKYYPGQIERFNADIMQPMGMPLVNNSYGHPIDEPMTSEGYSFGPEHDYWMYEAERPMDYRMATKALKRAVQGKDNTQFLSPSRMNQYYNVPAEGATPINPFSGKREGATFFNARPGGMAYGGRSKKMGKC